MIDATPGIWVKKGVKEVQVLFGAFGRNTPRPRV
jgi:hypothetical protein